MFMFTTNSEQEKELNKLYRRVKAIYGYLPPQMEFLGNIDAQYLDEFITALLRIARHPNIDVDFFGFVRLHIAYREEYKYCQGFNRTLLLRRGYTEDQLDRAVSDIADLPFDSAHRALGVFARKAIYESAHCTREDFYALYGIGWSQKDVFDAVEHAGTIFRNGRILEAYRTKNHP